MLKATKKNYETLISFVNRKYESFANDTERIINLNIPSLTNSPIHYSIMGFARSHSFSGSFFPFDMSHTQSDTLSVSIHIQWGFLFISFSGQTETKIFPNRLSVRPFLISLLQSFGFGAQGRCRIVRSSGHYH
jgi:hypothetical protein